MLKNLIKSEKNSSDVAQCSFADAAAGTFIVGNPDEGPTTVFKAETGIRPVPTLTRVPADELFFPTRLRRGSARLFSNRAPNDMALIPAVSRYSLQIANKERERFVPCAIANYFSGSPGLGGGRSASTGSGPPMGRRRIARCPFTTKPS
jgi:hypothetical protein